MKPSPLAAALRESALEREFLNLWRMMRPNMPEPAREFRFAPPRRWRFDFCWIVSSVSGVAVELEGGTWSKGRHTRGQGFQDDLEKYNRATLLGYRLLRYTADDLRVRPTQIVEEVAELIGMVTELFEGKR